MILSKYPNYSSILEIKKLYICKEEIEHITIITKMENLEILSLSSNKISSLYPLSNCINLREIYLQNNNINSFEELYHLKNLSKLKTLWLEGNPISKNISYIERVSNILPQLQYLDNNNIFLVKKCNKINVIKRGLSEEKKLPKKYYSHNSKVSLNNRKKICLRKIFSYFEPSSDRAYINISNESSIQKGKNLVKKINLSEFKYNSNKKVKTERNSKKNFKKIKLKIKSQKNNLCNNNIFNNHLFKDKKVFKKKICINISPSPKPIIRDNYDVQKSFIQNNNSASKEKKISFIANIFLYKKIFNQKDNDKIRLNKCEYENKNDEENCVVKAVYLLVDKLNVQDLLSLREVVDKKISILLN